MRSLPRPASLSARITLLLVLISLVILGAGSKWMDWRIDHAMESRFEQNLLTQALTLRTAVQMEAETPLRQQLLTPSHAINGTDPTYYQVQCPGMPPLRSNPPLPTRPPGWADDVPLTPRFKTMHYKHAHLVFVQFGFAAAPGTGDGTDAVADTTVTGTDAQATCVMLFAQDRHAMDELLGTIDWILLLSPALALLIALLAVPLVVRHGLRPMEVLIERMRGIGPNVPGQRLAPTGVRELDPLVARFNDVLARMDAGLANERQFASGLAHETRTRLAELRALAEVETRYPSGRSLPDVLAEVGSIGAELEATVTALLLLTRLQSRIESPDWQELALAPWLERQLQRQQATAMARGVELRGEFPHPRRLRTDPALLEVVIANLLANACSYAPPGDVVTLRLEQDGVRIDNAAPGLEADDLAKLGQRFWRKQLPHTAHAGLGLALARAAAQVLELSLVFQLDGKQRLQAVLGWPSGMGGTDVS
jgi:signal transduction histidine kinase